MTFMIWVAALMSGYIFIRAILPLRIHRAWKAGLAVPLLAGAFKFQILHWFGGPRFFAPDLPAPVLLGGAWLFAVIFFFFFLLLAADLVRCSLRLLRRIRPFPVPAGLHCAAGAVNPLLLAAAAAAATAGLHAGTAAPPVRDLTVELERLPPEAEGMTIAVLADLHCDRLTGIERIRDLVERVNARHPDLIVITGDIADGTVAGQGAALQPLRDLRATYGVCGVPGNHEYFSGSQEWLGYLAELGVNMLTNSSRRLPNGIVLLGVTDPAASRFGAAPPDLRRAGAGTDPAEVKILLAHQPGIAADAARAGIDLQISGHTHGGMVFGLNRLVAKFNAGWVSGLYQVGPLQLFVSNGAGIWSGFPIRLGVPAEIPLLRLVRRR